MPNPINQALMRNALFYLYNYIRVSFFRHVTTADQSPYEAFSRLLLLLSVSDRLQNYFLQPNHIQPTHHVKNSTQENRDGVAYYFHRLILCG